MQPLRFATAGSVDDGKSTLIGRLLYDARAVQEDQLAAVERASQRRGAAQIDLSLLTDGLEAEREQGITIDVAYRYFATPRRKFIIADGPGHVQYTRNMATGASNADALVLLLDVKAGLKEQTKKHLRIARLLGIRQVVAFLNKMDLVDWSREAFDRAASGLKAFAAPLGLETLDLIPGSALEGDMVVERGESLGWYRGPTLLERLETLPAGTERAATGPFRFPVQLVSRPQASVENSVSRGYMGRIESGHVLAGMEVVLLPSARRTRVRQILTHGTSRELAVAGDSVTLVLADDIDIARGDLIADAANPPRETRALEVTLVWLGHEALRPGGRYLVQQGSRRVPARVQTDAPLALNDIGEARLSLSSPLFVDSYDAVRTTGSLILIDEATNHTVAAGLVKVSGTVHLVGAGPGAPDLLTVRAVRLLGEADIVFHDALVPQEILSLIKGKRVPVGKRSGLRSTAQHFINKQLLDAARRYRIVVRLKGGDPMLFGRAHEEIEFLVGKGIPVKITPGITAALAAAADLGISLTRRGKARSVTFVTPRVGEGTAESSWVRAALAADTVAIYMGADELPEIAARLIVAGKSMATPVVVVANASLPDVDIAYGSLARLPQWESRGGAALVLIGDVYGEAAAETLREVRQASQSA